VPLPYETPPAVIPGNGCHPAPARRRATSSAGRPAGRSRRAPAEPGLVAHQRAGPVQRGKGSSPQRSLVAAVSDSGRIPGAGELVEPVRGAIQDQSRPIVSER
jgi:hypothetical protein